MKRLVTLAIAAGSAVVLLAPAPSAGTDKPCKRWNNGLDPCDGVVDMAICGDPMDQWSYNQVLNYQNWLYSSSAQKACKKWVMKHWGMEWLPSEVGPTATPGTMSCWKDENDDGQITSVDKVPGKLVYREEVPRDSCCARVPYGPYRRLHNPSHSVQGGDFWPQGQEEQPVLIQSIYARNRRFHGLTQTPNVLGSDVGVQGGDAANQLAYKDCVVQRRDDPEFDPDAPVITHPLCLFPPGPKANIDHIIPRIDSKGCPCGDNSSANALVISSELNTAMRNSCLDPTRIQILNAWTASPPP